MKKSRKDIIKTHMLIAIAMSCVVFLLYITGIGCPIKWVMGFPCPGCGLSRAWVRCFQLDLTGAFRYHPLFFLAPFLLLLGIHRGTYPLSKISVKTQDRIILLGVALFLILYVLRLGGFIAW